MRDVLEKLITLLELIGAWILFGAPLFQSVTELYEELEKREKLVTVINQNHTDQAIKKVSFWWWLFPPIKIALEKKKLRQIKKMTNHQLSEETKEALHRLSLKANGWAGVSLGGLACRGFYHMGIRPIRPRCAKKMVFPGIFGQLYQYFSDF